MIVNYIKAGAFLLIAILLFLSYNSGSGGALGSLKNRLKYLFSVFSFLAFVFFLAKAYYYTDNLQSKQISLELKREYNELEKGINLIKDTSSFKINEKQIIVKALIHQLDKENKKEYDTYFNILIGILITFICWVIVFTFRNKILG